MEEVAQDKTGGLGNLFEHLDVEDPVEWTTKNLPNKSSKIVDTYELEASDEDISFAMFCFLKDLTDIRFFVRETVSAHHIPSVL